jgi:hypothetical protein
MTTRIAGVLLGVMALAGACGGSDLSHQGKADAAQPDTPRLPDAPTDAPFAVETPLPTGTPVAIPLASLGAMSYTGRLSFGNQHQAVILDTGSSTLGVAGSTCTTCGVTPLYAAGSGAVDQHQTASSMYADGTGWTGEIYKDTVALGSGRAVALKFGDITSSSGFFRDLGGNSTIAYQGILGLGPDAALIAGTTSYLSTVFAGGTMGEIAFELCHDDGTMWLGGYDPSKQAGPQAVTGMQSSLPIYAVEVADMGVAGMTLNQTTSAFGPTIIDTGTSISFIPTDPLNALTTAIESSAGFQAAFAGQSLSSNSGCVTSSMTAAQLDAMLPPIEVTFPGLQGGNSPPVDLPATSSYFVHLGDMWCFAFADSAQLTGGQATVSLFGDSLLRAWVTTFDIAGHRMGFAPQSGCATTTMARTTQPVAPLVQGMPWWKQDPRVRYPSPTEVERRLRGLHD